MPASHHSVFYKLDALPAAQSTEGTHGETTTTTTTIILRLSGLCPGQPMRAGNRRNIHLLMKN